MIPTKSFLTALGAQEPIQFGVKSLTKSTILNVKSSPFALVNPALFVNYHSTGNVSYVTKNFILSDIRYLDGMDGAPIFSDSSQDCVGLVAGSLKKNSGEGDLTVVVPWYIIQEYLPASLKCRAVSETEFFLPWLVFNGVIMIEVLYGAGRKGWGSGILIDDTTIVSNRHLLGDNYKSVVAWASESKSIPLQSLGSPLEGFDLLYFKLSTPIPKSRPVSFYNSDYKVGQKVRSLGYGLIYPHRTGNLPFQPLSSQGFISKTISMDLYRQLDLATLSSVAGEENIEAPVMVISSASCWNGSSGGALFDSETGDLVGMMTSNGRVNETGEVIVNMAFSIPGSILKYGWDLIKKGETRQVSNRIEKLWKLEETHASRLVETAKL